MGHGANEEAADILIPVHNDYRRTRALLEGIYRHADFPFHIYVIDNSSCDETVDLPKIYTNRITVVRNRRNRGWGSAVNQGLALGSNPYVVFVDNHVELAHGWLRNLIKFLTTHPRIAAVGSLDSVPDSCLFVDRVRDTVVSQLPEFLTEDIHERNRILQYHFPNTGILVDGPLAFFCTAFTRRALDRVGPLTDADRNEPGEYCRKLRKAGYVLGLALDTYVVRHEPNLTNTDAPALRRHPRRAHAGAGILAAK
jgi:GT2 family glycosyltransferase